MEYFYVGTVALNYWMKKYFNREWGPSKDVDISSTENDVASLFEKYPCYDCVAIEFDDEYFVNDEGIFVINDNDNKCYATPEYLILTYYRRMKRCNYDYQKYLQDLSKITYLIEISKKRGFWKKNLLRYKEKNIDIRAFFSKNKYIHRIMRFCSTENIIGGEFALMYYYETFNKVYNFKSLDLNIFNSEEKRIINKYGSRVIPHVDILPYNEVDGFRLETIESIEKNNPDIVIPNFIKERYS